MSWKKSIFADIKVFACLIFALAFMVFPPSAAHAASGMHGNHHSVIVSVDLDVVSHSNKGMSHTSLYDEVGSVSKVADTNDSSGKCCSSICSSVVLGEIGTFFVVQSTTDRYLPLHAQANSIEPSGLLRPPQS
jgi:hypothetical protein